MLAIFKYIGELLTKIMAQWQGISISGFRPFWYLVGIALLTVFGFFIRGLLFSGAGGGAVSKTAAVSNRVKLKNNSPKKVKQ